MATSKPKSKPTKSPEQQLLEKLYNKERKRIQQFLNRASKRGYTFSESALPKKPKQIKPESISRLKKITPTELYRKSVYTSPTGTKIQGTERRKQERSESAKRAAETRKRYYDYQRQSDDYWNVPTSSYEPMEEMSLVFSEFVEMFESWTPESYYSDELKELKQRDRDRALGILTGARNELGDTQVAENIINNSTRVQELAVKILYESGNKYREDSRNGEINLALNELASILYGRSLTIQESLELTDLAERNEYN